eukprot:5436482-Prymnesium_polylepis.1
MHGKECYYDSKPSQPPTLTFTGDPTVVELLRALNGLDWMPYTNTKRPMQLVATTIEEQQFSFEECKLLKDATIAIDASLSTIKFAGDIAMPLSISTGVGMGKLTAAVTPYDKVVLKHVRMNHASVQRMLISEQSGDGSRMDKDALRQFIKNGCDICNSMKMKLFDPGCTGNIGAHASDDLRKKLLE